MLPWLTWVVVAVVVAGVVVVVVVVCCLGYQKLKTRWIIAGQKEYAEAMLIQKFEVKSEAFCLLCEKERAWVSRGYGVGESRVVQSGRCSGQRAI